MSIMDKITRYLLESESQPKIEFKVTDNHTELRIVKSGTLTNTKVKFYWDGKFHVAGEALTAKNNGQGMSIAIIDSSSGDRAIAERYIRGQKDGPWGLRNSEVFPVNDESEFLTKIKGASNEIDIDTDEVQTVDPNDSTDEEQPKEIQPRQLDVEDEIEEVEPTETKVKFESVKTNYRFSILNESTVMSKTPAQIIADKYNVSAKKLKHNGAYIESNNDGIRIMFESKIVPLSNKQITEISKLCPMGVTRNDFLLSITSEWK